MSLTTCYGTQGRACALVVPARTDPPLPLHHYRLAGELAEIRASGLAFTMAEARPDALTAPPGPDDLGGPWLRRVDAEDVTFPPAGQRCWAAPAATITPAASAAIAAPASGAEVRQRWGRQQG
jgi:hypothetical protein